MGKGGPYHISRRFSGRRQSTYQKLRMHDLARPHGVMSECPDCVEVPGPHTIQFTLLMPWSIVNLPHLSCFRGIRTTLQEEANLQAILPARNPCRVWVWSQRDRPNGLVLNLEQTVAKHIHSSKQCLVFFMRDMCPQIADTNGGRSRSGD